MKITKESLVAVHTHTHTHTHYIALEENVSKANIINNVIKYVNTKNYI